VIKLPFLSKQASALIVAPILVYLPPHFCTEYAQLTREQILKMKVG
jgi:hypothetical protein